MLRDQRVDFQTAELKFSKFRFVCLETSTRLNFFRRRTLGVSRAPLIRVQTFLLSLEATNICGSEKIEP